MKIDFLSMLIVLWGFLRPERGRQTEDEFLPKKSNKDLGRQEFEKFIYWWSLRPGFCWTLVQR